MGSRDVWIVMSEVLEQSLQDELEIEWLVVDEFNTVNSRARR